MMQTEITERIKNRDYTFMNEVGPEELPGASLYQMAIILKIPHYGRRTKKELHALIKETLAKGYSTWYGIDRKIPEGAKI